MFAITKLDLTRKFAFQNLVNRCVGRTQITCINFSDKCEIEGKHVQTDCNVFYKALQLNIATTIRQESSLKYSHVNCMNEFFILPRQQYSYSEMRIFVNICLHYEYGRIRFLLKNLSNVIGVDSIICAVQ